MTTLVFVTQLIDADDPVLGFVVGQVRALAEHSERVIVIANEVRRPPESIAIDLVSLGKERGWGRVRRGLRYERVLFELTRRHAPVALIAHMCPQYLNLAAPIARLRSVPMLLWYTHPGENRSLRRAERRADIVLTALAESYSRPGPKVKAIGHSIDVDAFAVCDPPSLAAGLQLLALGRTSPVKHYPAMIHAVEAARAQGADVTLTIVGSSTTGAERAHRAELEALIRVHGLGDAVTLREGVPPSLVPGLLGAATALVSATVAGSADKAVFEAMAAGRPVLVSNPAFQDLTAGIGLDLHFAEGDIGELANRMQGLIAAGGGPLEAAGATLRARVRADHSLSAWATKVVACAENLSRRPTIPAA